MLGYLPTEQLVLELNLGLGQSLMRNAEYSKALEIFVNTYHSANQESYVQEAMYYAGVAAYYLDHGKLDELKIHWNKLLVRYPDSIWSQRADVL